MAYTHSERTQRWRAKKKIEMKMMGGEKVEIDVTAYSLLERAARILSDAPKYKVEDALKLSGSIRTYLANKQENKRWMDEWAEEYKRVTGYDAQLRPVGDGTYGRWYRRVGNFADMKREGEAVTKEDVLAHTEHLKAQPAGFPVTFAPPTFCPDCGMGTNYTGASERGACRCHARRIKPTSEGQAEGYVVSRMANEEYRKRMEEDYHKP